MFPRVNPETGALEGPGANIDVLFGKIFNGLLGTDYGSVGEMLLHWWSVYSIFALLLALLFFTGFIYAKIRYGQLSDSEQAAIRADEEAWLKRYGQQTTRNSRWADVEEHIGQNDPNAWRLAIIEADILLEETLTNAGYVGVSIGDKLKTANPSSFTTVQDAWNAHKIRNQIAHAGGDFILTKKIAQDTIKQYERVFREFGVL